ncbi:protein-glutamine gamma-glutamyltransferase K-like isoform X3 [Biomphalaria glabrata]|uniref:Protein-glutamine gamma-glutamyltransferase K-like isoform X3 n=1 Tax=Biomphalaria glabrata TaxID=6526 RepID=A0A9W3AUY7_BIOGL|nr:protein-glutamine gamma-glutamyltransferase K-like isoform X3 [Biomphalaria glabrata]
MATSGKAKNKATISEKFASYYGNVKSLLLGNDLTGRRQTCEENPFSTERETQLTGFKRDKEEGHLKPVSVDLCRHGNRLAHRTAEYEVPNLILRRGQIFDLHIEFQREFVKASDSITLKFVTGSRPTQSRGSVVAVNQVDKVQDGVWGFQIVSAKDKSVSLRVSSDSDAIVGRYELFIDTIHRAGEDAEKWRHKHPDDIFLIFNPWHSGDTVYLPGEPERTEFVLNETGRIWLGAVEKYFVRPWNYGQFEYVCLIAAISILDRSELADRARGNPALVTRTICRAINYTESNGGVIQASWSGKYDDAVAPFAWTGSPSILEEFLKKRKGVKYGQCWTMAAVTTTLLRALGIPSRCVTCYRAVHDSDYSGAVNTHWSQDLRPKTDMDDAIWNFHVWNEAWLSRFDLPEGYGGWQALDPTPMDCSEGVVTCGPSPVMAILKGDLYLGFETKYLFAELHGGRVHWQVDADGNMEPFMGGRSVGGAISTKCVGTISRDDLTYKYKYLEGSKEEAQVLEKAGKLCYRKAPVLKRVAREDVIFTLEGGPEKGGDIRAILRAKNSGTEGRIVDVYMAALSTFYTGVTATEVKKVVTSLVIEPKTDTTTVLEIKCADFIEQKPTDSHVTSYVMAKVRETGQRYATVQTYTLDRPHLDIKTEGRAVTGQNFTVVVRVTNTLSVPLTNGTISVDGPGLVRATGIKLKHPVEPGEEVRETITLTARRPGVKEIIAVFYCRQICNVAAVAEIDFVKDEKN